ncbi:MAG: hypothetical protein K8R99_13745 [Actinomycetia bacterium]|nr:hypothetical protein [Actinomycetes bacterium]
MASLLVTRQLSSTSRRLRDARAELEVVGEQLLYVEEGPHEEAMQKNRAHLVAEIARLEAKLDRLLDRGPR